MKPLTLEWIDKAEGDFSTMERESRARKEPNYDAVCFHAQQCAEKYLKARLCDAGAAITKIHDLTALLDEVLPVEPLWEAHRKTLAYLGEFAVNVRYPGDKATKEDALEARKHCRAFRTAVRMTFTL
jgi:HEPN domain-containing protein